VLNIIAVVRDMFRVDTTGQTFSLYCDYLPIGVWNNRCVVAIKELEAE